jgi:CarD family transcriptional regulator
MFCLQEKVVYPGHGVAKVNRLVKKNIAGEEATFYELTFLSKDMTVLVPTENAEAVGIRPLSSNEHVRDVFDILTSPARRISNYEFTASNWNKRNKEYQNKLRTGKLKDLSEIYRDLHYIALQKELSFGEKNLLHQTEALLVEEISLVQQLGQEKTIEQLRSLCMATCHRPSIDKMAKRLG